MSLALVFSWGVESVDGSPARSRIIPLGSLRTTVELLLVIGIVTVWDFTPSIDTKRSWFPSPASGTTKAIWYTPVSPVARTANFTTASIWPTVTVGFVTHADELLTLVWSPARTGGLTGPKPVA